MSDQYDQIIDALLLTPAGKQPTLSFTTSLNPKSVTNTLRARFKKVAEGAADMGMPIPYSYIALSTSTIGGEASTIRATLHKTAPSPTRAKTDFTILTGDTNEPSKQTSSES